ncbi:ribonuclease H protein [Canna indica]|uniref:Ribonuclease H protein n=1 Tax=Canna indica TaxID=4628 RepID=A0AAQ3QD87_9LILI|nr:ribonuclease H protein [Canna indica]
MAQLLASLLDREVARGNLMPLRLGDGVEISHVGCVVLINYVLRAIHLHCLFVTWALHAILDKIDGRIHKFLWYGPPERNCLHIIAWDTITMPPTLGRLGILNIYDQCASLQAKRTSAFLNTSSS